MWSSPTEISTPVVLLADDAARTRHLNGRALREAGWQVVSAGTRAEALEHLGNVTVSRAVIEQRLPDGSGLSLIHELKRRSPNAQVVVLTRYSSVCGAVQALRAGAVNYVEKPIAPEALLASFDPPDDAAPSMSGSNASPTLAQMQWELANRVLLECDGNMSEAARRLGIDRRVLRRKLFRGFASPLAT